MAISQMSTEEIAKVMDTYTKNQNASYENNLKTLGAIDLDKPSSISIYPKTFESKELIAKAIEDYNKKQRDDGKEENTITYTDLVGAMMSSITNIIDAVSYALIAFVSISLVVSSIMIGIITYISVLERTKEIGILRAIGASKKDISRVFNAETFIIGLISGMIGVGITLLLTLANKQHNICTIWSSNTCNSFSNTSNRTSINKLRLNNTCRTNTSQNGKQKRPSRSIKE